MSADIVARLTEQQIVAVTLYGEARGESVLGQIAVGCVIRNRYHSGRWGDTYANVCLAPYQFSCWIPQGGKENYLHVMKIAKELEASENVPDNDALRQCAWVAMGVIGGWLQDVTKGATHYLTDDLFRRKPPSWALNRTPITTIEQHVFFTKVA